MLNGVPAPVFSLAVYCGSAFPHKSRIRELGFFSISQIGAPEDLEPAESGILLLDRGLLQAANAPRWLQWAKGSEITIIAEEGVAEADFWVPAGWPKTFTAKALSGAVREINLRQAKAGLFQKLETEHEKLSQLTNIGLALSAETDLDRLLNMILSEGRNFACCDAASLFLIDREDPEQPRLVFKLTQNDTISFPFNEQHFPLDSKSIAGFVAVTGTTLNLPDVYSLGDEAPYDFNSSFDESMGYHSVSMVAIPMKNHDREIIGVLQFLNRKTSREIRLTNYEVSQEAVLPFSEDLVILLEALASLAAIAIENSLLLARIQQLFEGFVSAAVTAIEQRDPSTSGHSFRVAELTTGLAAALPRSGLARFKATTFNDDQIREIRYASLLHDFGKVGVREHVLLKAKKLPGGRIEQIRNRFAIFKERLDSQSVRQRLDFILTHGREAYFERLGEFDNRLRQNIERYSRFFDEIEKANEPTILAEGCFLHLNQIKDIPPIDVDGEPLVLLTHEEFLALSVRKGSLTPEERLEIESHVTHTFDFLKQIPWTPELSQIPDFAVAHHEKLTGDGYPFRLKANEIPLPSKMMAVADIYDALTASDRPYKRFTSAEQALGILEQEARAGLIDEDLVRIFIEARIFRLTQNHPSDPSAKKSSREGRDHQRHVCDYDLVD